jgi:hypothetical protein
VTNFFAESQFVGARSVANCSRRYSGSGVGLLVSPAMAMHKLSCAAIYAPFANVKRTGVRLPGSLK